MATSNYPSTTATARGTPKWQQRHHLPPAPDAVARLTAFPISEMRQRRQWVGFRLVPDADGGRPQKIPVEATNPGKPASCTDASTWNTFEEALAGLADGSYTAVGYALDGDVVGIDLDGERWMSPDQTPTTEGRDILDHCGSYAERSISGQGLHVLIGAKLAGRGRRMAAGGIEIYAQRFLIVTGQHLPGTPPRVVANQRAVDRLYNQHLPGVVDLPHHEQAEKPEIMASGFSAGSVVSDFSALSVDEVLEMTLPQREGERNERLLNLARGLKFNAGLDDANSPPSRQSCVGGTTAPYRSLAPKPLTRPGLILSTPFARPNSRSDARRMLGPWSRRRPIHHPRRPRAMMNR